MITGNKAMPMYEYQTIKDVKEILEREVKTFLIA
jgi:hypothetical protein